MANFEIGFGSPFSQDLADIGVKANPVILLNEFYRRRQVKIKFQ